MTVYYNRIKEIYTPDDQPIVLPARRRRGEIRMILRDAESMKVVQDTGWFSNLILNTGLDKMGNRSVVLTSWCTYCTLGSDNTPPAVTDTGLGAYLGTSENMTGQVQSLFPSAPDYEFSSTRTCRFLAGENTGTIREIGFGWTGSDPSNNLAIRALVTPEISKAANQVLDVYYKLTEWPNNADVTGTIDIGGTNYDYIVRGANYTDSSGSNCGLRAFGTIAPDYNTTPHYACDSDIGAITGEPATKLDYIDEFPLDMGGAIDAPLGTAYRDWRFFWDLDSANGNIRSFLLRDGNNALGNPRGLQIRIGQSAGDGTLTKINTQVMYLTFRYKWGRR